MVLLRRSRCTAGRRFIDHASEIPAEPVSYLAEQLSAALTDLDGYDWAGRTGRRHREDRRVIHPEDGLPIEGVVPARWRDLVLERDGAGSWQIKRINSVTGANSL